MSEEFSYINHVHEELVRQAHVLYELSAELAILTQLDKAFSVLAALKIKEGEQRIDQTSALIKEIKSGQ